MKVITPACIFYVVAHSNLKVTTNIFLLFVPGRQVRMSPDYWGYDGSLSPSTREGIEARRVLPLLPELFTRRTKPSQTWRLRSYCTSPVSPAQFWVARSKLASISIFIFSPELYPSQLELLDGRCQVPEHTHFEERVLNLINTLHYFQLQGSRRHLYSTSLSAVILLPQQQTDGSS